MKQELQNLNNLISALNNALYFAEKRDDLYYKVFIKDMLKKLHQESIIALQYEDNK